MRTTLTSDDAIAKALRDLAHRSSKPFKQVVNETLRAGLSARRMPKAKPYRVKPASLGGVVRDGGLNKALALADVLEDQEIAAELERRK